MPAQLEVLHQLQELDSERYQLRRQQEEKPRELERVREEVAQQEGHLHAVEERLRALQLQQKEREVELQTREDNVRKLQGQLFQLKTNKEYSAMQREIDTLKADNSLLEEEILRSFDAVEQATQERRREQQQVAAAQEQLQREERRIEEELAVIADALAKLERQRGSLTPGVPPDVLSTYERILFSREGVALVPVVNETCGGCNRKLPPQVVNEAHLQARLVTCEHCSRILYVERAAA